MTRIIIHAWLCLLATSFLQAQISEQIIVDQIGYRPHAPKVLMIANPVRGQNSEVTYIPGTHVQIRNSRDNAPVMEIPLLAWNGGAVHSSSGDQVWQGDFSELTTPGIYHVYDPVNQQISFDFEIGEGIYHPMLTAAVKSYYYQRSGTAILPEYGGEWTHPVAHIDNQIAARLFDQSLGGVQPDNTARNVTGGWYDAGDYRKYTSWMADIIWDLTTAWEWWPDSFTDASRIPESGNGVPDILDEIKWETDWLLKMQGPDGACYSGVFVIRQDQGYNPGIGDPSLENRPYYYANFSTSATASAAASFALFAHVIANYPNAWPNYASTLREAAEHAWAWLEKHPDPIPYNHSGFDNADANKDAGGDMRLRAMAAAALFRLTGDPRYRAWFDAHYQHPSTRDGSHQPIISGYFETGASFELQRAMVTYALTQGATAEVVKAIRSSLEEGIRRQPLGQRNQDPYLCFMWDGHYCWSSNGLKAHWGMLTLWGARLNVNPSQTARYLNIAEDYLHYYHGRNPLSWAYLTQADRFGAKKPITRIYHGWFHDGTRWASNPAPGILAGGPNQYYEPDASYRGIIDPPQNQPPMKSYRDWNTSWPENSWSVTENSTGYQSRYIFLLAGFANSPAPPPPPPEGDSARIPLYRFFRNDNHSHFFTAVTAEKDNILADNLHNIWHLDGVSHHVLPGPVAHSGAVQRLFNRANGCHFYSMSTHEVHELVNTPGSPFILEGVAFYALAGPVDNALPVYRFFAPRTSSHFFTINEAEKASIIATFPPDQLRYEGIAWYAWP